MYGILYSGLWDRYNIEETILLCHICICSTMDCRSTSRTNTVTSKTLLKNKQNCPNIKEHTPYPDGYIQWHSWAHEANKTHRQIRCSGCNRFTIWIPRKGHKNTELKSISKGCLTC
ncbi:hypothetical protein LCGC14_0448950 [marine sediment metagenome]|uniref:Uncharacterized protein n=1 Tax=marine sediment metagenome TaxID=412755 RepID=A0A0F9SP03_9ZZZZ